MALKSDQAKVLRRRVLGGTARNLALFTAAYVALCLALEIFAVPRIAAEVADSTSVWRPLNSTEQFDQTLVENGLLGTDLFAAEVKHVSANGFSVEKGSAASVSTELDALDTAIEVYMAAIAEGVSPEEAGRRVAEAYLADTDLYDTMATELASTPDGDATDEDAEKDARYVDVYTEEGEGEANAGADGVIADEAVSTAAVPYISYEEVLKAVGINPADASAAEGFAALHVSARIQELGLSITDMPPGIDTDPVAILANAALSGTMDNVAMYSILEEAYPASQSAAYEQWSLLAPAEQARLLGIANTDPVWQVERTSNGTYEMRDIAIYSFVKSFKLPLAFLLFVAGWLFIIFHALNRSLRYFDELSEAVGKVIGDKDAPIDLPPDLSIARNELAVIRSQSLADERAAKTAEQRKNELVAYLAHDIRTPLTSVLGYLDLLRESDDLPRDTLRKYADIAYTKAERLEILINEFFEITRYNLSAIPIERETVGVRLFCQQVAEAFFPEASARGIRVSVDVNATDQFFIDPDKLARALGNVLRNAVAYADANSVIALTARQDARFTTITVANRGREISQTHLESIFEKFYREDGARSTRSGGAGLGLAIAKEIVAAHHGDIEAESQRGVTVFTLRLPTRPIGERSPSRPQSAAPLKPCNARHGRAAGTTDVRDNRSRPKPNPQGGNLEPHSHRHSRLRQPRTRR